MRTKELNVIIVILYDESGWNGPKLIALQNDMAGLRPDYFEPAGLQSIHIVYKNNSRNLERAETFLRNLVVRVGSDALFRNVRIGRQEGPCLCRVDAFGRIRSVSLGSVAYQAIRSAVS